MDVLQHVDNVRAEYLRLLQKAIAQSREHGNFLASEVGVELNQPDTGKPTLFRIDLLQGQKESPSAVMVSSGTPEEGALIGALARGNIEVAVYPFLWEACRLWFRLTEADWVPLEQWFKTWFADQEGLPVQTDTSTGELPLSGAVHHMTDPIAEGGGFLVEIDFGSAALRAFTELLDTLAAMGASDVRVGLSDGADIDPDLAAELAQSVPPLTAERFTHLVAQLLKDLDEVDAVETPAPLVLQIKSRGEKEASLSNLFNLWLLVQRTAPEKRPREVARFLRGHRESQQFIESGAKPDLSSLRPVIKPLGFIEHVQDMARRAQASGKRKPALSLVCTRLVGDLWIACVWDRPNGMQFVTAGEPEEFGLSREETLQRALKNYLDNHPEPQLSQQDGVTTVRTHDNYDATLLLDDAFWEKVQTTVSGTLLACAPTRDVILVSSTGSTGGELTLRRLARQYAESQNHAISTTLLRREKNVWLVHGKDVTAEEVSEAQSAKRAWWKFWM